MTSNTITLKEMLQRDFGIDLPISGGTGNSKNNPIIVEETQNPVDIEYVVLNFLGIGRNIEWKALGQEFFNYNGKRIDKIKIEVIQVTDSQHIKTIENYYFQLPDTPLKQNWLFQHKSE